MPVDPWDNEHLYTRILGLEKAVSFLWGHLIVTQVAVLGLVAAVVWLARG